MPVSTRKDGLTVPKKEIKKNWHCISCNRDFVESSFYLSYSIVTRGNNNRMAVCKKCIEDLYNILVDEYDNCKIAMYRICQMLDVFFDSTLYDSAEKQAVESGTNICKIYMQKINSLPQYRNKVFSHSSRFELDGSTAVSLDSTKLFSEDDKKNMNDVLTMLGYDPFINENEDSKKFCYNTLNGYLDEETLQDGFKISSIIEIVKGFNQLESINKSIADLTNGDDSAQTSTQLKTFIGIKGQLSTQINNYARENGVSINKANKSKGGNTLSGILKELRDKNIKESDVNLFPIRTCEAFKQIADVSNRSILEQLQFDENDYADIINQQREMIQSIQLKLDKAKEENRILRMESKHSTDNDDSIHEHHFD